MSPEMLQQFIVSSVSSMMMQFAGPSLSTLQTNSTESPSNAVLLNTSLNQVASTSMAEAETVQAELDALQSENELEEDERDCNGMNNGDLQNQTGNDTFATFSQQESIPSSGLHANRIIRNRDVRFSKVKDASNAATKLFRYQLSSYSVT